VDEITDMPTERGSASLAATPDGRWIVRFRGEEARSFAEKIEGEPSRRTERGPDFVFRASIDVGVTTGGPDGRLDGLLLERALRPHDKRTTIITHDTRADRALAWTGERILVAYTSGAPPRTAVHVVPVDCRPVAP
jgi:hypothetical protein